MQAQQGFSYVVCYTVCMRILPSRLFIQNFDAPFLRENFLVSAVLSVFVIRLFLKFTDYPQLGGSVLHIAHLLWGGALMLTALFLLFSFESKKTMTVAAVIGGLGFGAFIDELGKFITRDNNYFFQPTIALIYAVFVLLFIISQALTRYQKPTKEAYLVNALEKVKEAVLNDLDDEEKKQALLYLKKSDQNYSLTKALTEFITNTPSVPVPQQSILTRMRSLLLKFYVKSSQSAVLTQTVVFILLFQSMSTVAVSVSIFASSMTLPFDEWGKLLSSLLSAFFVLLGIAFLRFSKIRAYQSFKFAILIGIFLTQFFLLYDVQLVSFFSLAANILLLLVVDYVLSEEEKMLERP